MTKLLTMFGTAAMNKIFFVISIVVYILNSIIAKILNVNTHNSLWSGIFFITLLIPLCIGCVINSIIFKNQKSDFYFIIFLLCYHLEYF